MTLCGDIQVSYITDDVEKKVVSLYVLDKLLFLFTVINFKGRIYKNILETNQVCRVWDYISVGILYLQYTIHTVNSHDEELLLLFIYYALAKTLTMKPSIIVLKALSIF